MTDLTVTTWIVIALLATTIAGIGVAAYLAHVAHTARAGVEPSQERHARSALRTAIARARRSTR